MLRKVLTRILLVTALLLLVPLVAMQFTDEVDWNVFDFIAAGVLLAGAGFLYAFAAQKLSDRVHRSAIGAAITGALALVWIVLAVGLL